MFDQLYPPVALEFPNVDRPPATVSTLLEVAPTGSKSSPVYLAHSYPTKIPPEAIAPYIEHYTREGDIVVDPFAGSGMTGVAARRLNRPAILSDLSPLAVHLASNVTTYCDPRRLRDAASMVAAEVAIPLRDLYRATCTSCGGSAVLDWLLWGETIACTACSSPVRLWDAGFDREVGRMLSTDLLCPECGECFDKRGARVLESAPVWASVTCLNGCGRMERPALYDDMARAASVSRETISWPHPDFPLDAGREMYVRSALHLHGVRSVADFYTPRNLAALASLWSAIAAVDDLRLRQALAFAFTNTAWHGTRMRRFNARGGQRPLTGTLYIPQMSVEVNVLNVFQNKIRQLERFFQRESWQPSSRVVSLLASASRLEHLPDRSVDYVFTDPPFGGNIFYADCAIVAEAWLGRLTDVSQEAVVNRSLRPSDGGKTVEDYKGLMVASFSEMARVLKVGGRATVVFQNTDPAIWNAVEEAFAEAGFVCDVAHTLDKTQHSHKGYKGRSGAENVAGYDMVLTLTHRVPRTVRSRRGRVNDAVSVLRSHLGALPPVGSSQEADRQMTLPYLYAMLLRAHFNGDIGLDERGYALVRDLCEAHFTVDRGRWLLWPEGLGVPASEAPKAHAHTNAPTRRYARTR